MKNKQLNTKKQSKISKENAEINLSFVLDTDEQQFLNLMNKLGVSYEKYTQPDCIYTTALELGAVVEYTIKRTSFSFNAVGQLVGFNDEGAKSFTRPHSKENE